MEIFLKELLQNNAGLEAKYFFEINNTQRQHSDGETILALVESILSVEYQRCFRFQENMFQEPITAEIRIAVEAIKKHNQNVKKLKTAIKEYRKCLESLSELLETACSWLTTTQKVAIYTEVFKNSLNIIG